MTDDEIRTELRALFKQAKKDADDRTWVFMGVVCIVAPLTWAVIWGILYAILHRAMM